MSDFDNRLDKAPTDPSTVLKRELQIDRRARVPGTPRPITDLALTTPGVANPLLSKPSAPEPRQPAPLPAGAPAAPKYAAAVRGPPTQPPSIPPPVPDEQLPMLPTPTVVQKVSRTPKPQTAHKPASSGLAISPDVPVPPVAHESAGGGTVRVAPITAAPPKPAVAPDMARTVVGLPSQQPRNPDFSGPATVRMVAGPGQALPFEPPPESMPTMIAQPGTLGVASPRSQALGSGESAPTFVGERTAITTAPEAPPAPLAEKPPERTTLNTAGRPATDAELARTALSAASMQYDDSALPTTLAQANPPEDDPFARTSISAARKAVAPSVAQPPPTERMVTRPSTMAVRSAPTLDAMPLPGVPTALHDARTLIPAGAELENAPTAVALPRGGGSAPQPVLDYASEKLNQPVPLPPQAKGTDPVNSAELVAEANRRAALEAAARAPVMNAPTMKNVPTTEPSFDGRRVDAAMRVRKDDTLPGQYAVTQVGAKVPVPNPSPQPQPSEFEPSLGDAIDSEVRKLPPELIAAAGPSASFEEEQAEQPVSDAEAQVGEVDALEVIARPASTFRRLGAWFVDTVLYLTIVLGAAAGLGMSKVTPPTVQPPPLDLALYYLDAARPFALHLAAGAVGAWVFFVFLFAVGFNGRSPGRKVFGLHLVTGRGQKPGFLRALWRSLVSLLSVALAMMGYWVSLFSRQGRTMHDAFSGTIVVRVSPEAS